MIPQTLVEIPFDMTMSATVMELLDAERMLREMVRVTRPGGRVGVVVRAIDMQSFVNVPVRTELKMKIAGLPNGLAGAKGCADSSLYQRRCCRSWLPTPAPARMPPTNGSKLCSARPSSPSGTRR